MKYKQIINKNISCCCCLISFRYSIESYGMKWYISLVHQFENIELTYQGPVVQKADNAFDWISDYPVTIVICLSDLFAGWCCPSFKKVNSAQGKRPIQL